MARDVGMGLLGLRSQDITNYVAKMPKRAQRYTAQVPTTCPYSCGCSWYFIVPSITPNE